MFRTDRYFKKNDGQHNFYGEEEYIENKDGTVTQREVTKKSPQKEKNSSKKDESG